MHHALGPPNCPVYIITEVYNDESCWGQHRIVSITFQLFLVSSSCQCSVSMLQCREATVELPPALRRTNRLRIDGERNRGKKRSEEKRKEMKGESSNAASPLWHFSLLGNLVLRRFVLPIFLFPSEDDRQDDERTNERSSRVSFLCSDCLFAFALSQVKLFV